jgi:hypothetical protein
MTACDTCSCTAAQGPGAKQPMCFRLLRFAFNHFAGVDQPNRHAAASEQ